MSKYAELIERVKAATGPDRELDGDIAEALELRPKGSFRMRSALDAAAFGIGAYSSWKPELYTASIDAALALVERCLPGWIVDEMGHDCVGTPGAMKIIGWTVELSDGGRVNLYQAQAPTAPLAIILALLLALDSQP